MNNITPLVKTIFPFILILIAMFAKNLSKEIVAMVISGSFALVSPLAAAQRKEYQHFEQEAINNGAEATNLNVDVPDDHNWN